MRLSKKQLGFVFPIAILIAVVLIIAGGAGYYFYKMKYEYSSPEKTFSRLIKAAEDGDADAWLKCYTEESQKMLKGRLEEFKTDIKFYKEGGFKVTEKTSDRAVMISSIPTPGGILVFKKEKGNWKIGLKETITEVKKIKEKLSEEEKKEEAKKLINEALFKIEEVKLEKAKAEADMKKLSTLINEAINSGKNAVELDPKNPEILFQMGNLYFEIKESVSGADVWAEYYYKKALELDPDNSLYQEKLRKIQSQK